MKKDINLMPNTELSKKINPSQYRWIILLSMIYLIGWTSTYLMIYKMVTIHHILEPGAIFLFPLSYAVSDIIAEVYGYQIARKVVWFALIAGLIFCGILSLVAMMPAPNFWHNQIDYEIVFSPLLRAYFATTIASLAGNFINIYVISKGKILMLGRFFPLRSLLSTGIGELVFSILGGTLAYAGIEPWSKIIFLMLDGYIFKMGYAFLAVWPALFVVNFLKESEKVDVYDKDINYNPFSLM